MRNFFIPVAVAFGFISIAGSESVRAVVPRNTGSESVNIHSGIRSLSNSEASKELPVAFQATVTNFRADEGNLFVQDGGVGLYVNATTAKNLSPGDRVRSRERR